MNPKKKKNSFLVTKPVLYIRILGGGYLAWLAWDLAKGLDYSSLSAPFPLILFSVLFGVIGTVLVISSLLRLKDGRYSDGAEDTGLEDTESKDKESGTPIEADTSTASTPDIRTETDKTGQQ